MVSDSATVGMDDMVGADSQSSNAGGVKKSDNCWHEEYVLLLFSLV